MGVKHHATTHGCASTIRGRTPLYRTWEGIKQRCYNPNDKNFKYYGLKGIKMFNDWVSNFSKFKEYIDKYLGERPFKHSLDRINNLKNYTPNNLRWASSKQQNRNRSINYKVIRIDPDGKETIYPCLSAVADDGFNQKCVENILAGRRKTHKKSNWRRL